MGKEVTNGVYSDTSMETMTRSTKLFIAHNISHFKKDESKLGQRLYKGLSAVLDGLEHFLDQFEPVSKIYTNYDLSPDEPGSGMRSIVNMAHAAITRVHDLMKKISLERGRFLFSKHHYVKEVEAWSKALAAIVMMFDYMNTVIMPMCVDGDLKPDIQTTHEEAFTFYNTLTHHVFYGRCQSFHYHTPMQRVFKFLSIALCIFSEVYYSDGGFIQRTIQSLMTSGKYTLNSSVRGRRMVDIIQYCSAEFMQSFWALFDLKLLLKLNSFVGYNVAIEERIIVPCEDMETPSVDGGILVVKAPHSWVPSYPIPCYLLSSHVREGMQSNNISKKANILPKSDVIIYHCHGGGYISQSTAVQGVFLNEWCVKTSIPIFSIDYSLSPYAPFPRALEEMLTVYVWMLNNSNSLGWTGKTIILTGDSGGGNMMTAMTIKCFEMGIRPPDSLLLIYTPFSYKSCPSPSRLLAFMDPLLPLGFALRCAKAYAHSPTSPPDNLYKSDSNESIHMNGNSNDISKPDNFANKEMEDQVGSDLHREGKSSSFVEVNECDLKSELKRVNTSSVCKGSVKLESVKDKAKRSRKLVREFHDRHVVDTRVDEQGNSIPILRSLSVEQQDKDAQFGRRLSQTTSIGEKSTIEKVQITTKSPRKEPLTGPYSGKILLGTSSLKADESCTFLEQFTEGRIDRDYLVEIYDAPREIYAKFPPTYFMTAEYDFGLDDSVMMAKLFRSLGVKTKLKVLAKLPHGFLNLCLISKDAREGNKVAISMLQELVELNETMCK